MPVEALTAGPGDGAVLLRWTNPVKAVSGQPRRAARGGRGLGLRQGPPGRRPAAHAGRRSRRRPGSSGGSRGGNSGLRRDGRGRLRRLAFSYVAPAGAAPRRSWPSPSGSSTGKGRASDFSAPVAVDVVPKDRARPPAPKVYPDERREALKIYRFRYRKRVLQGVLKEEYLFPDHRVGLRRLPHRDEPGAHRRRPRPAARPALEDHRHRPQLPGARQGAGEPPARGAAHLPQAADGRHRPPRRRRPAAASSARVDYEGEVGRRHPEEDPPAPRRRSRRRRHPRLHLLQRRHGPRPADEGRPVHPGQGLRHLRRRRPLHRHGARSGRAPPEDLPQRQARPVGDDRQPDLLHPVPRPVPVPRS